MVSLLVLDVRYINSFFVFVLFCFFFFLYRTTTVTADHTTILISKCLLLCPIVCSTSTLNKLQKALPFLPTNSNPTWPTPRFIKCYLRSSTNLLFSKGVLQFGFFFFFFYEKWEYFNRYFTFR